MSEEKMVKEIKDTKNKNRSNKGKNRESAPLTYNLSDILDELYPQYKPSKKKEDKK